MISASKCGLAGSRGRLSVCRLLLTGTLLLCAPTAHAEDAETRTAARDLATQGAQAFDAGHYAEASDFFRRAHDLVPAPSIALLQARSLAKLGQLLEAIDIYEQTSHFKLAQDAPEAYAQAVETAHSEVEEVRKRLPRLKLSLVGVAKSETPQVTMDDKPTPPALLGVERPVNPGLHRISVLVAGEVRATHELSLSEGQSSQLDLQLKPAAKPQDLAAPAPVIDSSPAQPSLRTWGFVGLGVGVLGFGIGTYTGLVAMHHKSDLDAVCHPGCPQSSAADVDAFRSNRTLSWLSYGVGVAAAATGIVLLTLGKPGHEHVAFRALPTGFQIGGQL